ncbi:MAG TPA: heparan-alpha-glucosaminide N-acetyltransferase domain-containing protein [Bacteroidota bacterium]|nr:heparan-alpha-glucosaminide N-acetyltransferase domain-containing protein [Bacteroidota bacterium]
MDSSHRIHFLDYLRGFAVVVMVVGHSIDSVLSMDARATEIFRLYDAVRGFTAPIFLFVAGYAFIVATRKRWNEFVVLGRPVLRRVTKMFLLLLLGYVLHFPFFSFAKLVHDTGPGEYAQFFQVDVLHCLAVSILLLQVVILLARTPGRFVVTTLIMTIVLMMASPLVWSVDLASVVSPFLSPYFNQQQVSIFPLFPYAGFLFSGVVVGHLFLAARREGRERVMILRMVIAGVAAIVCGIVFDVLPVTFYPPHDYWKTSPNFFLIRIGAVLLVTGGFALLRSLPDVVERHLVTLGQASLMVYAVHLILVYGSSANDGLAQIVGQTLAYHQAFVVGALVLFLMIALVHGWNYLRTHHYVPSRVVQAGFASSLLYLFFTKPW